VPYCNNGNVLEIGIGGGRVALSTIQHVGHLFAVDISQQMLKHA
jgi:ubiquinone/menaquinone biosynthesis C-methylase UbiE